MLTHWQKYQNQLEKIKNKNNKIKDVIDYDNVFGNDTGIYYSSTLSGFKEDIILDSYTGVNEFKFNLKTNGLKLASENGEYFLVDPETNKTVVDVGELLVYDSSENVEKSEAYNHCYTIDTIKPNNEYLFTIIVDESYLLNENTIYPVVIDPSFQVTSASNGIMDISVFAPGSEVITTSTNLGAGWHPQNNQMRSFIKFPALLNNSLFINLAPSGFGMGTQAEISNITLNLYSRADVNIISTKVNAYVYNTANALDWDYNTTLFTEEQYNAVGNLICSPSVPTTAQWIQFNITSIGSSRSAKGIVLRNEYEGSGHKSVYQSFASTKDPNLKPYITFRWSDSRPTIQNGEIYRIKNVESGKYLTADGIAKLSNVSVQCWTGNDSQRWKAILIDNDTKTYAFIPQHIDGMALDVTANNVDIYPCTNFSSFQNYNKFSLYQTPTTGQYVIKQGDILNNINTSLISVQDDYISNPNVITRDTGVFDKKAVWTFELSPSGSNKIYSMVGTNDAGHDHTGFFNNPIISGYTKSTHTDISGQDMLSVLCNSTVFLSRSHGNRTLITGNGSNMNMTMVSNLPNGALNNLKLVYYGACSTGEGGITGANLVNATYDRGAQIVIGFGESVGCNSCNTWTKAFMTSISNGTTVAVAMVNADNAFTGANGATDIRTVRGNTNVVIN